MLTCKSFGMARDCVSCKHAPINQQGKPAGQPISPPIKKDGKCPHYVQTLRAGGR